jgi:Mechanosensitive ion channel
MAKAYGDTDLELEGPGFWRTVFTLYLGLFMAILSFFLYVRNQNRELASTDELTYMLAEFCLLLLGSCLVCKACLGFYARKKFQQDDTSFGFRCVQLNGAGLSLGMGLVLMSLIYWFPYGVLKGFRGGEPVPSLALAEAKVQCSAIESKLNRAVEMLGMILSLFKAKDCFIYYLSYTMHWGYYKKRILKNTELVRSLKTLNKGLTEEERELTLKERIASLFKKLSGGKEFLSLQDLTQNLDETSAREIFSLFDSDVNSMITEEEFYRGYINILSERSLLRSSLIKRDKIIEKLDTAFIAICMFLSTLLGFLFMGLGGSGTGKREGPGLALIVGIIPLVVTSTMSIHGRILTNFIGSISFIFFVRPFDIGDLIVINGQSYVVESFGIVNSAFKIGEKVFSIPNRILMASPVENLSRSLFYTGSFSFTIPLLGDAEISQFREEIERFIGANRNMFKGAFCLGGFSYLERGKLSATLRYTLTCTYMERAAIEEREDMLKLFVYRKVEQMEKVE